MNRQQGRRIRWHWHADPLIRVLRLGAVLMLLTVATAVIVVTINGQGPPSRQELLEQAGLIGKRELLIGVKSDHPGMALHNKRDNLYAGFDIDIAYMIAEDLGFQRGQVRFLPLETEDRARMQARDVDGSFKTVDLVVATFSITPERERMPTVSFSAPYLRTEQTVMTRSGGPPKESLSDFKGQTVCTTATSTNEGAAKKTGITLVTKNSAKTCVDGLLAHTFDAVASDAVILAGFAARHPKELRLHDIGLDTIESYGINTGENDALTKLVNLSLYKSRNDPHDHRWEDAFNKYLAPEQKAAIPQQVAIAEQPPVPKIRVREWPWENAGSDSPGL